jgi:hypothetical protein
MKRLALVAPLVVSVILFAACRDQQPLQPKGPSGPAALIVDGAHNGTDRDFFFLPPIAPNPVLDPHFDPGAFNPNLSPTLSICRLKTDLTDCEATILSPVAVQVSPLEEQYKYLWDTKASNLDVTRSYRVLVQLGTRQLGVLDVQPVDKGVKNAKTGDVYQFQDDRTVPINFRIEFHGLSCASGTDCGDGRIANDGGLVTTNTGFAGALFPDGWLPANAVKAGITQVVVHIERILVNDATLETSCLQSGLVEVEGCYRFTTVPDLHPFGRFSQFVTAGVCFQFPAEVGTDAPFQMHRREETNGQPSGAPAVALASARADFLTCDGFVPPEIGSHGPRGLRDLARSGWRTAVRLVGRLIKPRELYAVDLGAGGGTDGFSRFGWARPTAIAAFNTLLTQSAVVNATLPISVKLVTTHHVSAALSGATVTFTLAAGGGFLGTAPGTLVATATTVEGGVATVNWTLPSTAGTYTLEAASPGATGSPVTFTATATATGPLFGEIITPGAAGSPRSGVSGMSINLAQCGEGSTIGAPGSCTPTDGSASAVTDANGRFATQVAPGLWQIQPNPQSAEYPGITPIASTVAVPMVDPKGGGAQFTALILDQAQSIISIQSGIGIGGTVAQQLAQTVTSGVNGIVTEIHMPVWCSAGSNLTVVLMGVGDDNAPDGVALGGSTVVPGAAIPQPGAGANTPFRSLVLTTPLAVALGQRYAIVLGSTGNCALGAQGPLGSSYGGGDAWFFNSTNGRWVLISPISGESQRREDFPFQVLVQ